jgi:oligopeptide/dipeptide ABC transporter ATP-binding protein
VSTKAPGRTPRSSLAVEGLTIEVKRPEGWLPAVRDVSFELAAGERIALVGESGSGKSLTALSLGGLLPQGARVRSGRIAFGVQDLLGGRVDMQTVRGRSIAFVFQNPTSALDPLVRIGAQIEESMEAHGIGTRRSRRARAIELLELVGVHDAARRVRDFPHQFSGGMQQRVVIASALAANPRVLVADEPTTALDVTVQARILSLLRTLSDDLNLSLLLVTHDLAVARQIAESVIVMYAGRVLETAPTETIVSEPDHPYTEALIGLVPDIEEAADLPAPIPGRPVPAWEAGDACPFVGRCPYEQQRSRELPWALRTVGPNHRSACVIPRGQRHRREPIEVA